MFFQNEPNISRLGTPPLPFFKQIKLFLTGWLGFHLFAIIIQIVVGGIASISTGYPIDTVLKTYPVAILTNMLAYIVLLISLTLITRYDITKLLKSFKHWQPYVMAVVCVVAIYLFNYMYSIFLYILRGASISNNQNEASLQSIESIYPMTSLIVFGIIGPICEELTYRVGLFSLFQRKSRLIAYIVTILMFTLIHFNFSLNADVLINELLNLPYYIFGALAFTFIYDKFGFASSLTAHILNNILSLSLISIIR